MAGRPNIVLITSDQHRADTLGCTGHPCVRTPHLDMLASEGVRFNQAYTDCPVCIPSRTTLVTGRQAHRYGKPDYAPSYRVNHPRDQFLGALMTAAGYQTCLVGKTHWHTEPSFRGGFEAWVPLSRLQTLQAVYSGGRPGRLTGIGANEFSPTLSAFPARLCSTDWIVDRSMEFIQERERDQPFFLWASMIDPHPPNTIHEPYYSMYDSEAVPDPALPEWSEGDSAPYALRFHRAGNGHTWMKSDALRKARGVYYGKVTNIDHQIGRLLGALIAAGVWDNTVIVYSSDHGDHLGDYGDFSKSTFLDGSARIPLIMRYGPWRDALGGGHVCDSLVQWADLLPTFCELAGTQPAETVDGVSLLPLCTGQQSAVRDSLHGQIGRQHMFHDGRYKYLYFVEDGRELLFDKSRDPFDEYDLAEAEDLIGPIRQRMVDHLISENHTDVRDGQLIDLGMGSLSPKDLSNATGWLGLAGA